MIPRAALLTAVLLGAAAPPPGGASCSGCHGGTGMPLLAGRPAADTVAALDGFRAGTRPATVMSRIAKGFTPTESQAIAAWWAGVAP